MANVIEVIVRAIDQASGTLTRIEKNTSVLDSALVGLKKAAVGVIGVFSAGAFMQKFIDESSQAEQAVVRLDIALKAFGTRAGVTRQQMLDFAAATQQSTEFGDEAVVQLQTTLLRFDKITGETFTRARQAAVDLAAALGQDLQSAAFQLGIALQSPENGMRVLRRAGIILSEQERKLVKDFQDVGKIAEAQDIILRKLEKAYAGTAVTVANTFDGAMKQLQNTIGELFEGPDSLPNLTEQVQALNEALKDPEVKAAIDIFAATFVTAIITISKPLLFLLEKITELITFVSDLGDELNTLARLKVTISSPVGDVSFENPLAALERNSGGALDFSVTKGFLDRKYGDPSLGGGGPRSRSSAIFSEKPFDEEAAAAAKAKKEQEEWNKVVRDGQQAIKELGIEVAKALPSKGGPQTGQEALASAVADIDTALENERERGNQERDYRNQQIEESMQEAKAQTAELQNFALSAAGSIQQAFANAFLDIDSGVKGMVKGFLQAFKQIIAQAAAMDLAKVLGLGSLFSGSAGGTATGSIFSGLGKLFGFKASGGYGGGMTVTGEEGPELGFFPPMSKFMNSRQLAFVAQRSQSPSPIVINPVYNISGLGVSPEQLMLTLERNNAMIVKKLQEVRGRRV